jgi:hypothetical protein
MAFFVSRTIREVYPDFYREVLFWAQMKVNPPLPHEALPSQPFGVVCIKGK